MLQQSMKLESRTMVLRIYGVSENNDRLSASTIREASNIIAELKLLYNTQHVIAAGDYNAVLEPRMLLLEQYS